MGFGQFVAEVVEEVGDNADKEEGL